MKTTSFVLPEKLFTKALMKSYETGTSLSTIIVKLLLLYTEGLLDVKNHNPKRNLSKGGGEEALFDYINRMIVFDDAGRRVDEDLTAAQINKYFTE